MQAPELATPRVALPNFEEQTPQQQLNQAAFLHRMLETLVLYTKYASKGAHIYDRGDVPAHVIARRRARNKVARISRRKNR